MVLGNGKYYSSHGSYNPRLDLKVRTAIQDICQLLRSTRRYECWSRRMHVAYRQTHAMGTLPNPILFPKQHSALDDDFKRIRAIHQISREFCNTSELFADALLQYLSVRFRANLQNCTIGEHTVKNFLDAEAEACRLAFVGDPLLANLDSDIKLDANDFRQSFYPSEIEQLGPYFDIVWNWLITHSEFELQKIAANGEAYIN